MKSYSPIEFFEILDELNRVWNENAKHFKFLPAFVHYFINSWNKGFSVLN